MRSPSNESRTFSGKDDAQSPLSEQNRTTDWSMAAGAFQPQLRSLRHIDSWVRQRKINSTLHEAVERGDFYSCMLLLGHSHGENGIRVQLSCKNEASLTPLHVAADRANAQLARWLLEHGANVNALTTQDSSPLHLACSRGSAETVALLVHYGADVNAKD